LFKKLWQGLTKTRQGFVDRIKAVVGSSTAIDDQLFEELEEILITADVGVDTTINLLDRVRAEVRARRLFDPQDVIGVLQEQIQQMLAEGSGELDLTKKPTVILVVGVNGTGKTTTIGKLAHRFRQDGLSVIIAAADTFRAAAIEQLQAWGQRAGADVVHHQAGSDPAAVVFDALAAARARRADAVIIDTAGRLHTQRNLMEELKKVRRVVAREVPDAPHEVLLVVDATTGQNGLQQARLFGEAVQVSGIVLTKLDGTAKGGIVIPIAAELGLPVKFVGVGEGVNDLQPFIAAEFVPALFGDHKL
jgi:fused signal recognition particle receptor